MVASDVKTMLTARAERPRAVDSSAIVIWKDLLMPSGASTELKNQMEDERRDGIVANVDVDDER